MLETTSLWGLENFSKAMPAVNYNRMLYSLRGNRRRRAKTLATYLGRMKRLKANYRVYSG